MERGGIRSHRLGISATAAPPRSGEVYRTPIEDTFDGIRFEVSRMLESVKDSRREPLVVDTARYLAQGAVDYAIQMGENVTEANQKLYMLEGFHWWCQHYCFFLQDPTGIEYFQIPQRMIRQKLTPVEILEWIWSPVRNGMALSRGIDPSSLSTPEGKASGDCEEFVALELAFCVSVDIYPVKFIFGGNDGTLHHVWGAAHTGDGWHQSDPTQKGFKLDETLPFDHYDEVEVPL